MDIRLGLVGVGLRGLSLRRYAETMDGLKISAICEIDRTQAEHALDLLELDSGSWKAGDKATLKCMIAIFYYKLTIDRRELIEIDAENMIRKINGVDQLSSMRQALGV